VVKNSGKGTGRSEKCKSDSEERKEKAVITRIARSKEWQKWSAGKKKNEGDASTKNHGITKINRDQGIKKRAQ
jgi:hypothetical protein